MMKLNNQKGLSLVELLVAMVLGIFLMGQVIQVVVNGKRTFQMEQELSQIQENARFALEFIAQDIRMAGYTGCNANAANISNAINSAASAFNTIGVNGFEHAAGTGTYPGSISGIVLANTDAIMIGRADSDSEFNVTGHNSGTSVFTLAKNHPFQEGAFLMVADANCNHIGVFQQSNVPAVPSALVAHTAGGTTAPTNCTPLLGQTAPDQYVTCSIGTPGTKVYGAGSKLMPFVNNTYYIAPSVSLGGVPALWREPIGGTDEELVQGVENIQLSYGVDSNNDGIADRYGRANQILAFAETSEPANDTPTGPNGTVDWNDVVSVRVSLLMRSMSSVLDTATANPALDGAPVPTDRFLRQTVVATVQLRNGGLL